MKSTLPTIISTCTQTLDYIKGFLSVHMLRGKAAERLEKVSWQCRRSMSLLVNAVTPGQLVEATIPSDERHRRGSFYSLHGTDPRTHY